MDLQLKQLESMGMFLQGHFVLRSGLHTDTYVNCMAPVNANPRAFHNIVKRLTLLVQQRSLFRRFVIVSIGKGAYYGHVVSQNLTKLGFDVRFVELRRGQTQLELPFGQERLCEGRPFIFVDDVFVTGKTLDRVQTFMHEFNSHPFCCITIVDRNPVHASTLCMRGMRIDSLFQCEGLNVWENREHCPLCKSGIPFSTEFGKGAEEFAFFGQPGDES